MGSRTMAPPMARAPRGPVRAAPSRPPAPRRAPAPPRPRMDPRIAARRIGVARSVGRRRLRRLLVALATVAVLAGAAGAVYSPVLDIDRFDVRGADDRGAEVIAASGLTRGAPVLLADTAGAEQAIGELPWVGSVRVERALLGTIRIVIRASVPVAWLHVADGSVVFVDARGRAQTPPTASVPEPPVPPAPGTAPEPVVDPTTTLPELVVAPDALGPEARPAPAILARVAASLGPLAARVASVAVADGVATLQLRVGPEIRLGRVERLAEKARAAAAVLAAPAAAEAAYVDVSVPAAPVTG